MAERRIAVPKETIAYEGYFETKELYLVIQRFIDEHGYDRVDTLHEIKIKEHGRYTDLVLDPEKPFSPEIKGIINMEVSFEGITDETVELDDKKININKGKVSVAIKGILESNFEFNSLSEPKRVFFRVLLDKLIYKRHYDDHTQMLSNDIKTLKHEINSFLNLRKYLYK